MLRVANSTPMVDFDSRFYAIEPLALDGHSVLSYEFVSGETTQ